jgi:general secretion pathway protein I
MREAGFTLVETLIALAVFAIAGIAFVQVGTQAARTANETEARTLARWAADTLLAEAMLDSELSPGVQTGQVMQGGMGFDWTRTVTETGTQDIVQVRFDLTREGSAQIVARMDGYEVGR